MNNQLPQFQLNTITLPKAGYRRDLVPTKAEMEAIASSCGLVAVSVFEANVKCRPWHRDGITVSGRIKASIEQVCVVSLEPVFDEIKTEFSARFVPSTSKLAKPSVLAGGQGDREIVYEFDGDDAPEPLEGEELDLWEVLLEHFNLAIEPFPRAKDQQLQPDLQDEPQPVTIDEDKISPFAALAALKRNET